MRIKLRKIVSLACQRYGRDSSDCRIAVKGNRKITYLVKEGEISHEGCFLQENIALLLPEGFTVCFEACTLVWIARIGYREVPGGSISPKPLFEVVPLNEQADEMRMYSSGWSDNISQALRQAILRYSSDNPTAASERTVQRPNGRLFIGVYYEAMQKKLKEHFKARLEQFDLKDTPASLITIIKEWIEKPTNIKWKPSVLSAEIARLEKENKKAQEKKIANSLQQIGVSNQTSMDILKLVLGNGNALNSQFTGFPGVTGNNFGGVSLPTPNAWPQSGFSNGTFQNLSTLLAPRNNAPQPPAKAPRPKKPKKAQTPSKDSSFEKARSSMGLEIKSENKVDPEELKRKKAEEVEKKIEANTKAWFDQVVCENSKEIGQEKVLEVILKTLNSFHSGTSKVRKRKYTKTLDISQSTKEKIDFVSNKEGLSFQQNKEKKYRLETGLPHANTAPSLDLAMQGISSSVNMMSAMRKQHTFSNIDTLLGTSSRGTQQNHVSDLPPASPVGIESTFLENFSAAEFMTPNILTMDDLSNADLSSWVFRASEKTISSLESSAKSFAAGESVAPADLNLIGCNMTPEALYLTLGASKKGSLGTADIAKAYKCLKLPFASSLAKKTVEACDRNGDGRVSLDEFLEYLKRREEELRKLFNKLDVNGDGSVSKAELVAARQKKLFQATDEEINNMINWMDNVKDGNKDGLIDFEEFRTCLILLPPATTIQELVNVLRTKKAEESSPKK